MARDFPYFSERVLAQQRFREHDTNDMRHIASFAGGYVQESEVIRIWQQEKKNHHEEDEAVLIFGCHDGSGVGREALFDFLGNARCIRNTRAAPLKQHPPATEVVVFSCPPYIHPPTGLRLEKDPWQ